MARSRLHLTLHFLGSVPSGQVTRLRTELDVGFGDFELTLGVPAIWPRGIAVVLPLGRHKPLDALHRHLAERLKASRLPVENRPFQPHITLARRASSAIPPEQACHLKWQVCSYALVRSAGGRYTILAGFDRRRAMPRELDPG